MAVTPFNPSYPKTTRCTQTSWLCSLYLVEFVEPEFLPIKVYVAVIEIVDYFCSCNLDLALMTFVYELDTYPLPWRYTGCAKMNFVCQGFWKLSYYHITAHGCVHLVTCGHFQSHDKVGSHTIWSAISENPVLHANFMGLCFRELKLLLIEVLCCGNNKNNNNNPICKAPECQKTSVALIMSLDHFCSCDLGLHLMTFMYELDSYPVEIYMMCGNELAMASLSKVVIL